jgi:hypothetical protein
MAHALPSSVASSDTAFEVDTKRTPPGVITLAIERRKPAIINMFEHVDRNHGIE